MRKFLSVLVAVMMVASVTSFAAPVEVNVETFIADEFVSAENEVQESFELADAVDYHNRHGEVIAFIDFEKYADGDILTSGGFVNAYTDTYTGIGENVKFVFAAMGERIIKSEDGNKFISNGETTVGWAQVRLQMTDYATRPEGYYTMAVKARNYSETDIPISSTVQVGEFDGTRPVVFYVSGSSDTKITNAMGWTDVVAVYDVPANDYTIYYSMSAIEKIAFDDVALYYKPFTVDVEFTTDEPGVGDFVLYDVTTNGVRVSELVESVNVFGSERVVSGIIVDSITYGLNEIVYFTCDTQAEILYEDNEFFDEEKGELVFALDFESVTNTTLARYMRAENLGAVSNFPKEDVDVLLSLYSSELELAFENGNNYLKTDVGAGYTSVALINVGGGKNYLPFADTGIYTITYDARFTDGAVPSQVFTRFQQSDLEGGYVTGAYKQVDASFENTSDWQTYSFTFDAGDWENGVCSTELYQLVTSAGEIDYDNFRIYYKPFENAEPEPELPKTHIITAHDVTGYIKQGTAQVTFELEKNDPGFAGMTFDVEYDDTVLDATAVSTKIGSGWVNSFTRNRDANPIVFVYGGISNVEGTGEFVTLKFDINDSVVTDTVTYVTLTPDNESNFYYEGYDEQGFTLEPVTVAVTLLEALPQDITVPDEYSLKYGDAAFALDIEYGEGVNAAAVTYFYSSNEDVVSIDSNGVVTVKNAGTAFITVERAGNDNYIDYYKEINVTVAKKKVYVTARSYEIDFYEEVPALTYTHTSLVAGDSISGSLYTSADGYTPGKYDIEIGTLAINDNYIIEFTKGTVTVRNPKPITLSISADKNVIMPNAEVKVDVNLQNTVPGIAGITFEVIYDEDLLEYTGIESDYSVFATSQSAANGSVICVWLSMSNENMTQSGLFATFIFKAKTIEGTTSISCEPDSEGTIFCYAGNDYTEIEVPCNITEPVEVVIKNCMPGDANADGRVTNRDAARILQYIAGWDVDINLDAADANGDGTVNNRDAARILQYLAKWDVELIG